MDELRDQARQALENGTISGFLGLADMGGGISPCLVTRDNMETLELLALADDQYPLAQVLATIAAKHPDETLGVMVRGCDQKAIVELCKAKQLDPERVLEFEVSCSQQLTERCHCRAIHPADADAEDGSEEMADDELLSRVDQMDTDDRFTFWMDQFGKCIKCFGCRNICPVCYCRECALEDRQLVSGGIVPPDTPIFHLIKAYHMVDRCTDCGLCEQACPMGIPLRTLYRKMGKVIVELFGYVPGQTVEERSPLSTLEEGRAVF